MSLSARTAAYVAVGASLLAVFICMVFVPSLIMKINEINNLVCACAFVFQNVD
jgi:hypothetical protein